MKPLSKFDEWLLHEYNGELQVGDTMFDGVQYDYRAVFNDDEDIDLFITSYEENMIRSARCFENTYLTLFFTIKDEIKRKHIEIVASPDLILTKKEMAAVRG